MGARKRPRVSRGQGAASASAVPLDLMKKWVLPHLTLHELAEQIYAFRNCRTTLMTEQVGTGLTRALYATYVSYLPPEQFTYDLPQYCDERGIFVEMLKTPDCGQFSFFTVKPSVKRGSHYHHTKTEKFLVVKGVVRMCFRHMISGETFEVTVFSSKHFQHIVYCISTL